MSDWKDGLSDAIDRLLFRARTSRVARLFLFVIIFLLVTGLLVVMVETGRNTGFIDIVGGFWWSIITFSTTG